MHWHRFRRPSDRFSDPKKPKPPEAALLTPATEDDPAAEVVRVPGDGLLLL